MPVGLTHLRPGIDPGIVDTWASKMSDEDNERKVSEIEAAWKRHLSHHWSGDKPEVLRNRLSEAQNWRCCYCGQRMMETGSQLDAPTFEHVVPRSLGGSDDCANLVIACFSCNVKRGPEMWDLHSQLLTSGS